MFGGFFHFIALPIIVFEETLEGELRDSEHFKNSLSLEKA